MSVTIDKARSVSNYLAKKYSFYFQALAIYEFGSVVYGHKTPSDIDFIYVMKEGTFLGTVYCPVDLNESVSIPELNVDVTIMSETVFLQKLNEHEISALECLYLPKNYIVALDGLFAERLRGFSLDLVKLRHAISSKSSNSYVKAKKKLIVEEDRDVYCSIKSLWHSFRILEFGTQLAKDGKIHFSAMNYLWGPLNEVYNDYENDWEKIHEEARPLYNEAATEFKKLAPKA